MNIEILIKKIFLKPLFSTFLLSVHIIYASNKVEQDDPKKETSYSNQVVELSKEVKTLKKQISNLDNKCENLQTDIYNLLTQVDLLWQENLNLKKQQPFIIRSPLQNLNSINPAIDESNFPVIFSSPNTTMNPPLNLTVPTNISPMIEEKRKEKGHQASKSNLNAGATVFVPNADKKSPKPSNNQLLEKNEQKNQIASVADHNITVKKNNNNLSTEKIG